MGLGGGEGSRYGAGEGEERVDGGGERDEVSEVAAGEDMLPRVDGGGWVEAGLGRRDSSGWFDAGVIQAIKRRTRSESSKPGNSSHPAGRMDSTFKKGRFDFGAY